MRIGLQIPSFTWPGGPSAIAPTLRDVAQAADEGGFASLWVMDHFFQIPILGPAEQEMLEGYGALHWLAGQTRHVTLGTLVTGVTYRPPALLVKQVSTLDVLSGGRAWLGIGAAWFEREHRGLGVAFPPLGERFEHLEDALRIAKQMWSGDDGPFQGRHHRLEETLCVPAPLQSPHPPILIGGMGERRTLRLVARHADACNLFTYAGMDTLRHKLDVLRGHCEAEGRDFESLEKTSLSTVHLAPGEASVADVIGICRELAAAGIDHAIFNMPNVHEITPLEVFAREVVPEVSAL
jgi:F420-dependent oxidoreductase-like protein